MSRGIKRNDAEKLLINGFILDAIEKITDLEIKVVNSRNKISNNFSTQKISNDLIMVYEEL